jgi:hypothetical protein
MRPRATLLPLLMLCLLGACAGCAKPPATKTQLPSVSAGGVLRATEDITVPPFVVEQRLKGTYGQREFTVDCVVQFAGNKVTVVGLTPFGTRAFAIEQVGTRVTFQKFIDRELPIEPADVLYDVHRVFFRALAGQGDGVRESPDASDLVRETWQDGHLVERRFQSLEGPVSNLVVVTFEGAPAPVIAPIVRLTNAAYGYTLELENSGQKLLESGYTLEVDSAADAGAAH